DTQFVCGLDNIPLQPLKLLVFILVIQFPQKLELGVLVTGRAVAADANPENSRPTPFPLRLQHRIQNHLPAAVEVAVGLELLIWQRVLRAHVLATAAFEYQPDSGLW